MPARPDPHTELERALTRVVRRVFLPTAGEATRRQAGVNLERATYSTLARIADLGHPRLTEVAAAMGLDTSTASRHTKRLIEDGLIEVTACTEDARARRYRPSDAGREALQRVREARRARLAQLLDTWEPEEIHALAVGLDRLVDALEADDGRAG
ncbi:MAG: MarR family winged helix-turn-helix transcriptional regulator [Nitriliruptoraceae bacterium]